MPTGAGERVDGYFLLGQGGSRGRPDLRKPLLDIGHCRSPHADTRVAPGVEALVAFTAPPHVSDAEAGDEADTAVDGEHLAVIARHPAERRIEARLIERAHGDAGTAQALPEHPRRGGGRTQPVVHHAHLDAALGGGHHRRGELPSRDVVAKDVALEVHPALGAVDRGEPRGKVLLRIAQQLDAISLDQGGARRPRKRLVGDETQGGRHVSILPDARAEPPQLDRPAPMSAPCMRWLC